MKTFFSSIKNSLTPTPVTKTTLSVNELIAALDKYSLKDDKHALENIASMRNHTQKEYRNLKNLTLETASQKYDREAVVLDLVRNKPEINLYKNKQQVAGLHTSAIPQEQQKQWFTDTMEMLKDTCNNAKLATYFSHLASQNVMNSGGNMIQLLTKIANKNWIPKMGKEGSSILTANEKGILYTRRVPIQHIIDRKDIESGIDTPAIANDNQSPIAYITIQLKIDADKHGKPRHHLAYQLESQNEPFRKNILQPLHNHVDKVRQETTQSKKIEKKDSFTHWHLLK